MERGGNEDEDANGSGGMEGPGDDRPESGDGDAPFQFLTTKDGKVFITWNGKAVAVLRGKDAARFLERAHGASAHEHELQMLMARVTGNFKRGNERASNRES